MRVGSTFFPCLAYSHVSTSVVVMVAVVSSSNILLGNHAHFILRLSPAYIEYEQVSVYKYPRLIPSGLWGKRQRSEEN